MNAGKEATISLHTHSHTIVQQNHNLTFQQNLILRLANKQ